MNKNEKIHNNNVIEQKYQEQKAKMLTKYDGNLRSFSEYHGADNSVSWDMLFFNARCFAHGIKKEVIPGGGTVNVPELIKDYKVLEDLAAQVK